MFSGRSPVSRICRVLLFAFLAAIPGVLVTANASSGGVLFQSNWDTALGTSDAAFRDTSAPFGPWTLFEVGGTVRGNPNEMVVVNTTAPVGETQTKARVALDFPEGARRVGGIQRALRAPLFSQATAAP